MAISKAAEVRMGRPRGFDEAAALEAAMRVFWEKSYEGATMADLTAAMGINRSSIYAAFGDKESLFRRVLDRYQGEPMTYVKQALAQASLREVVAGLINGTVEFLSTPGNPRGCLSIQGGLACGRDAEPAKQALIEFRKSAETAIKKRLLRAQYAGELAVGVKPADFARYISSVMAGLAVQAACGTTNEEMTRVAAIALNLIESGIFSI